VQCTEIIYIKADVYVRLFVPQNSSFGLPRSQKPDLRDGLLELTKHFTNNPASKKLLSRLIGNNYPRKLLLFLVWMDVLIYFTKFTLLKDHVTCWVTASKRLRREASPVILSNGI